MAENLFTKAEAIAAQSRVDQTVKLDSSAVVNPTANESFAPQANETETLAQITPLDKADVKIEPVAGSAGEPVVNSTPLNSLDTSHELPQGEEAVQGPDRLAKQIEIYGGEENYNDTVALLEKIVEDYLVLKTAQTDKALAMRMSGKSEAEINLLEEQVANLQTDLIWQETQAVYRLLYGEKKAEEMILSTSDIDKNQMMTKINNFLDDKDLDKLYLRKRIIANVAEANWSLAQSSKDPNSRNEILKTTSTELKNLTEDTVYKDKDFSLLFIDYFAEPIQKPLEEQPAEEQELAEELVKVETIQIPVKTLSKEEIAKMGAEGLVSLCNSLDPTIRAFDAANNKEILEGLYPQIKNRVIEQLTEAVSKLPESKIKDIFSDRANLDKIIDTLVVERTKAEANIVAMMGNAVFTNEELTMLRAINTRALMRRTLGEFAVNSDIQQLEEIIQIMTPLCLYLEPQSVDQSKIKNADASAV